MPVDHVFPSSDASERGGVTSEPYSSRVFSLPKTHAIEHSSAEYSKQLIFHVWTLSFFKGMRLTTEAAGFLDSTVIKPGVLVDFVPVGQDRASD